MIHPLISTDELAGILDAPDLRIVDASWRMDGARPSPQAPRIPGAVRLDIDAVADHSSPLPHMLPEPGAFAEAVGALGLSSSDHMVVYDDQGLFSAARVWWMLRIMGAARVQVLDGGLPAWLREKRPTATTPPATRPRPFHPSLDAHGVADLQRVRRALNDPAAKIIDARSHARFMGQAGEPRPGLRAGHMPGAVNLPYTDLLRPDGRLRPRGELAAAFDRVGLTPDQDVITTCGSGVTAAILTLALAVLGRDSALYDGSWAEWGAGEDLPVETG